MRRLSLLFLAVCAVVSLIPTFSHSQTTTINACVNNRTGTMRIVTDPAKCNKRTEKPLSWYQVAGPQGLAGLQGKQGPQGAPGTPGPGLVIQVYDANDQYLGVLMAHDGRSAKIYIPSIGKFLDSLYYKYDASGFNDSTLWVLFAEDNCQGQPFFGVDRSGVYAANLPLVDHIFYLVEREALYVVSPRELSAVKSQAKLSTASQSFINCLSMTETTMFFPLVEIPKTSIPFSLPLSLPLQFRTE